MMIYLLQRQYYEDTEPVCYFQNQENAQRVCDKLNSFLSIAKLSLSGANSDIVNNQIRAWRNACIHLYDTGVNGDAWGFEYTVTPVHSVLSAHTKELAKLLISPAPSVAH